MIMWICYPICHRTLGNHNLLLFLKVIISWTLEKVKSCCCCCFLMAFAFSGIRHFVRREFLRPQLLATLCTISFAIVVTSFLRSWIAQQRLVDSSRPEQRGGLTQPRNLVSLIARSHLLKIKWIITYMMAIIHVVTLFVSQTLLPIVAEENHFYACQLSREIYFSVFDFSS